MAVTSGGASSQAQGVVNFACGTFTGAGLVAEISCGFKPRHVRLINLTDRIQDEVTDTMAATHVLHTVAAGTVTDDTGSLIVLKGAPGDAYKGFQVAAAAAINAKVFHWIAHG